MKYSNAYSENWRLNFAEKENKVDKTRKERNVSRSRETNEDLRNRLNMVKQRKRVREARDA